MTVTEIVVVTGVVFESVIININEFVPISEHFEGENFN
jgi:hypothetical protein